MIWTIIYIAIIAVCVIVDQITKVMAVERLADGGSFVVIPNVLQFTYVENRGMALGLMQEKNMRWIFISISILAIVAMSVYLIKWRPKSKFACVAMALIIGGGIGNMIDRIFFNGVLPNPDPEKYGQKVVRDFIDFKGFGDLWPWVFNLADAFVCVGGAMLFLWCVVSIIQEAKNEKKAKAVRESNGESIIEVEPEEVLDEDNDKKEE